MRMLMLTALFTYCFLQLTAGMSVGDFMQGSKREAREVREPIPIDCKMTAWTVWAPCDPCTKTMHRSRGIEIFGQFGGQRCIQPIGEKKPCKPTTQCVEDPLPVCSTNEFLCESGFCIKKRLVCNGDNDCDDSTDEDECDKIRSPCGNVAVSESDIGLDAGYGINILGTGPRMNPFNNKVYKGICDRVKEPSTLSYNRLPWNVAVINYETLVEETTSKEVYKDTHSLLSEITQDITSKTSIGLSFKFTPTDSSAQNNLTQPVSVTAGFDRGTEKREMIKTITEHSTTKEKSFFRVKGKVQLGTYRMRSRGLEVSQLFLDDVDALPLEYEKGQYFGFLEDYGTHYTKNGRVGGEYELVYVLNNKAITDKKKTESLLKDCLKIGINLNFQVTGGLDPGTVNSDKCTELKHDYTVADESEPLIDKVISAVKGGSPKSAAAMKSGLSKDIVLDWSHYVEWAATLSDLPALIHSDPEPIYNAIPLNFPDAQPRRENLQRALNEYMAEYSVCKCQPCQNGGTVAQVDGNCICLCPLHFEGLACQTIRHELIKDKDQPIEQLGNWGCWSSWSSCSGGRQSRTRSCKTGGIAGVTCKGDSVSEEYC
ncbi:complement component C9 [Ictalurus furcatus]|uniref:complement component C9 n=1 Tax=Ictalurus furcatus TaxID=66913 RepID=UPI0023507C7F|nr:complement component C9 [Ictalurus furcatus]